MKPSTTRIRTISGVQLDGALDTSFRQAERGYPARSEDRVQQDLDAIAARAAAIRASDDAGPAGLPLPAGPCRAGHWSRWARLAIAVAAAAAGVSTAVASAVGGVVGREERRQHRKARAAS